MKNGPSFGVSALRAALDRGEECVKFSRRLLIAALPSAKKLTLGTSLSQRLVTEFSTPPCERFSVNPKRREAHALQRTDHSHSKPRSVLRIIFSVLLVSSVFAQAQAPRKDPLTKYRQLWEKSLVTEKPPPPEPDEAEKISILDDYVLGGWTQSTQGYLVSLINSKNPKERKTIAPGMPNKEGFRVVDVKRDPTNYKSTQVLIQLGEDKRWIGYEEKFMTIQQPPAVQKNRNEAALRAQQQKRNQQQQRSPQQRAQNTPPLPPTANANNRTGGNQQKPAQRQPRVRRVPVPPKK